MVSSEEAKIIANEYLEKNGYKNCSFEEIQDKIVKWVILYSDGNKKYYIQVSRSDGAVLGFEIK
ncbi:MAG: hypothetical protein GF317_14030 [Candidatus Lokiarchaeota archaeon]|nr:hypothetical protein [Candidatus Lokiarchaeota archaeon]MBD3200735.1 hypothetical protein [Candidatus Lokiarchaeota archaeon]